MSNDKIVNINGDKAEQPVKRNQDVEIYFWASIEDIESVKFENIIGHQIGQHWVAIFTEDGTTKLYPNGRIKEITVTTKE